MEKVSMVSQNTWERNRMWEGLTRDSVPRYNPVAEFRTVKTEAQSAIADLLTMLPEGDVRCGMAKTLAEWLSSEIELLPDDLCVKPTKPDEDYY